MDNNADLVGSALFSPSKARAQQAQAKDWASVDAWLAKKLASKRLPAFERNEETLQALLTLATLNETVDEQRSHVDRVEKAALSSLSKRAANVDKTYHLLLSQQEDQVHLTALAETAVTLESPGISIHTMASGVIDLTTATFEAQQSLHRVDTQLNALKAEQVRLSQLLADLNQDVFQPSEDLVDQTAEWTKGAKHLRAKVGEYDERLAAFRSTQTPAVKLEDVKLQTDELEAQRERLEALEMQLKAFQSLPTNAKAARAQLESARGELLKSTRQREGLFERLAEVD